MDQNEARSTQDATIRNDIPQNKCKPKRKRMKQRSAGWDHFVKYTDKDGSTRARCKYCPDKSFACDSISNGTSNLLRHSKSCTMNPENAMTQTVLKLQSNIINGEGTLSCWRYDQDAIRTSLAHMLIIDELSFRFVEKEGFRYFMSVTCPKFQLPSRITIAIGKTNMLIYVSVVLDPRHKLRYIDFVFSELHKQGDGTEIVMTKNVKDATYELFISYQKNGTTSKSNENTQRRSKDDVQESVITDMKERYKKFKSLSGGVEEKSELEKYLTEENVADSLGFSILSWWKINGSRFPVLSQMARDILAVPISTVASESTFSTGGRVLDSYRTSLSPKVVQALICTQDWIRKSHKSLTIEDESHENEELDEELSKLTGDLTMLDL